MNFVAKEKAKKTKSTAYSKTRCKSNYQQQTYYTSHKVNEKYHTHKQTKNRTIGKMPLSDRCTRGYSVKKQLTMHMLADIQLQSWTKPVICGV